ncbi:hypothetical protein RclHR1_10050001 [Rhizophagus clarus]|uniref:BTB/POZ protein n=1 Tax=Rhizophagus clarus TaxID=94130 RepID=A0A2Z6QR78_9GLOM|nr:hypothetical protein RclHR1_10050001 [Rhizophagus clarus]GES81815.1 BTB/POZ protein [Rhizophagus clarus]
MESKFFSKLSQDLYQLLDDTDDYDVIIKVGEKSNTKEFHARSNILKARSPYFKMAFSQNRVSKKDDIYKFVKPNISPIVFEMIIIYVYTGILDLREKAGTDILELLVASDEFLMEELITFVQKYLIENQTEWLQNNFVKVLHTVFQFESCKQLQDYCLESICDDPEPFFNSPNFPTLEKNILLGLLKRDDLSMDEIELWKNLIKWGIAQNSELNGKNVTNLNRWNKSDFLTLKNTLYPFISHIRFFDISSKDFHSKIWPFKTVLPVALFEDIVSFHFTGTQPVKNKLPPRSGKFLTDSKIIRPKHATILANWIQRNDINSKIPKNKYNFNLIYRGSRDGFDINTMRSKCNGQGACVLIIQVKENGTIIGGYNPLDWNYVNNCNCEYGYYNNSRGIRRRAFDDDVYCNGRYCNNCGGYYNGGYCNNCGINGRYCNNCGGYYNGGYCNNCGINGGYCNNCGGYHNSWADTKESFIFSLDDGKDLKKVKISRVINNNYAIYNSNIALNFGNSDLIINGNSGTCNQCHYESSILDTNNFSIEEMEIFKFCQG